MPVRLTSLSLVLAASTFSVTGCGNVGFYSQAIGGHLKLMRAREPIDELLASESLDPALRTRLETVAAARRFAVEELDLPETDSYRTYAETGRRYVTWNVVAAEEFSVRPYTWCFPVAGCVNYRGYFAETEASAYAEQLREQNYDVTVGGASAYSTLGWFDDPVLDTMLRGNASTIVGTLFHEMAHQKLYVQDDSDFNEAYASFVEQQGTRIWLDSNGASDRIAEYERALARAEDFAALLASTRAELEALYAVPEAGIDDDQADEEEGVGDPGEVEGVADTRDRGVMRAAKAAIIERLRERYETLRDESWDGYGGYDSWFSREINNARLVSVSTYRRYVPAFAALYDAAGQDLARFHELASEIGELPKADRVGRLDGLLSASKNAAGS